MKKLPSLTLDATSKTLKGKFKPSNAAERDFYKALKKVAHVAAGIVDSHVDIENLSIKDEKEMRESLKRYSDRIGPWAERQSKKLLDRVMNSNRRAYAAKSKAMGRALEHGLGDTNVGVLSRALQAEQTALIKSIPIEAGQRAQEIAMKTALSGGRALADPSIVDYFKEQMGTTTEVAVSRAKLIARTETARANASINQARALSAGSGQYRWHNSADGAVRESHLKYQGRKLQGRIFSWDNPPTLDDGMTGHPGTFPNCRCFAEPIFDES